MNTTSLRVGIGIATSGRAEVVREVLRELGGQTVLPQRILVCYSRPEDLSGCESFSGIEFIAGPMALTGKRNAILDALADCDVVLFLDDDFLPQPRYLEATLAGFALDADVWMTTGFVIEDDKSGPGLSVAQGRKILADDHYTGPWPGMAAYYSGYGCNMAVRTAPVRAAGLRFDERLPLYGFLEDMDFSRRLARHGRITKITAARGVHLAVKSSRVSGRRMGYSQICNAIYLLLNKNISFRRAADLIGRGMVNNLLRSITASEPYVDRRGRLVGNWIAIADLLRGRVRPERILDL